ncbi:hypothetical protein ACLESO_00150 [Pyxidicoccus sp. 3LG]
MKAAFDTAWKTLSRKPGDMAARDAFAGAWLDWEFHLLDEERKEALGDTPPLKLDGCPAGTPARDCIAASIGRRFDSAWFRVEMRGDAVLVLFFHARAPGREDPEAGNQLVVFRGTLQTHQGAAPRLALLSRNEENVSDTLGAALGRGARVPDPKDPTTRWGIRFEPLGPQEYALIDALPDEWVALREAEGRYWRYRESPAHGARFFIVKEPGLRMAWLSFIERDGHLEALTQVSKEGNTYRFGGHELRWPARSSNLGLLTDDYPEAPDEPYIPVRYAKEYEVFIPKPTPEQVREENEKAGTYETENGQPVPEMVGRVMARLCARGYIEHLKSGLYEVRCSCGTSCGASTFVDVNSGRTSSLFSIPLAVDPEGMRVAISTDGRMPLRIVGMFDEKEWLRLRRPTEETADISGVMEASFNGNRLNLRYLDRRGEWAEEEDVDLPDRPVEAPRAHE